jgi:hypothetical protein
MFVNKRTLLVSVTLDASGVGPDSESRLLEFKTAMWIVAIAALHCAFQHLVMERQLKLVLRLAVTTEAQLRFAGLQQTEICEAWLLRV